MPLSPGDKLGPYEILAPIGKGGMGEVYRAHDSRLNRDVAIKTSAEQFSDRFAREAKVIASLNHPNICTLFDIGPNYLAMEMIEGPTLTERIKQGAMSLEEAAGIMRQVADALDYAHEKGVVHRDLKPGNIKIRPDGVVKVLDFGLAKMSPAAGPESADPETVTVGATQEGVVLGTAAYMSPEQAMGKPVDKRADVWAFGVVFYEMLTGARMHKGHSVQEVIAAVLRDTPDLAKVPAQAHRLLKRCLEKDPNKRLRHIGDVMALLDDAPSFEGLPHAPPRQTPSRRLWPAFAMGALLIGGAALLEWGPWRSSSSSAPAVTFEVGPAKGMTFIEGGYMTVSPDGHWMVFPAVGQDNQIRYWLRSLDGVGVRMLPGTETSSPGPLFWSPDSRWVILLSDGKLEKLDIQGGSPQKLADWPWLGLNGSAWNQDGVIIAGTGGGDPLQRIPSTGGSAIPVTAFAKGDTAHRWPQFLPDGKHFLYQRVSSDASKFGVYIGSIDAKPEEQSQTRLLDIDRQAFYAAMPGSASGYLVFLRGQTLMAQRFDPDSLKLSGEPVSIVDGVDSYPSATGGLFSVSEKGTLVFRKGLGSQTTLTWVDLQGRVVGTLGAPADYNNPAISPDGSRVAVSIGPEASRDIWILDVMRGTSTRFTFSPARDDDPAWSPDGKTIAFVSNRGGQTDLYVKPSDNSGEETLLLKTGEPKEIESWSPDGRFLLIDVVDPKTLFDIWAVPLNNPSQLNPLVRTPFFEGGAHVSPDGHWLAYTSAESGVYESYVRPFTPEGAVATGAKWTVSKGGGVLPLWRPDGKQLFYAGDSIMAVDIDTSKGFQPSAPRRLFLSPSPVASRSWALAPDGKRFLLAIPADDVRTIPFTVVVNWAAALKK